jgi:hypothetical protein
VIHRHDLALRHTVNVHVSADAVFDAFGFEGVAERAQFGFGFHDEDGMENEFSK